MILKEKVKEPKIPEEYYSQLAMVESSGDTNAEATTSSAAGMYQFVKKTWNEVVENMGKDWSEDDRFDPVKSRQAVEYFTNQNRNYLKKKLGKEPNKTELYMTHLMGMGGGTKFLKKLYEYPDIDVTAVATQKQINANRPVFLDEDGNPKRLRDVYDNFSKKFGEETIVTEEDSVIYGEDEQGNTVNINPEEASELEIDSSDYYKDKFYTENLTNYDSNKKSVIFAEEPEWKSALKEKVKERFALYDLINQGALDVGVPERKSQLNRIQKIYND